MGTGSHRQDGRTPLGLQGRMEPKEEQGVST